jgi:hypothetical protein
MQPKHDQAGNNTGTFPSRGAALSFLANVRRPEPVIGQALAFVRAHD